MATVTCNRVTACPVQCDAAGSYSFFPRLIFEITDAISAKDGDGSGDSEVGSATDGFGSVMPLHNPLHCASVRCFTAGAMTVLVGECRRLAAAAANSAVQSAAAAMCTEAGWPVH